MINIVPQKAIIIGAGSSGEAAARLLVASGTKDILLLDAAAGPGQTACAARLAELGVRALLGTPAVSTDLTADIAIISPGVDPRSELVQNIARRAIPIIAEIELAFRHATRPVVAITGTNGKTTTTELTTAILEAGGLHPIACGNIGLPFSEAVLREEKHQHYVVETSSFQLETIVSFRPKVAVWLNFSPDHLDRHPSLEAYHQAKLRIFENQTTDDFAVVNASDSLAPMQAKTMTFSAAISTADLHLNREGIICHGDRELLDTKQLVLRGAHNHENLMAALGSAIALGIDPQIALPTIQTFKAGRHRLEPVEEINGVRYINDSKSTNPDSLAKALASFERIILIAGGKDKGFDFKPVADLIQKRTIRVFLIGEMAQRIATEWTAARPVPCTSLADAVKQATEAARPGDTVLFSPGTSSFDMFRDYADRGDQFCGIVRGLKTTKRTMP